MKTPVVLLPALLCNAGLFIHQIKALENDADFLFPIWGWTPTLRTRRSGFCPKSAENLFWAAFQWADMSLLKFYGKRRNVSQD